MAFCLVELAEDCEEEGAESMSWLSPRWRGEERALERVVEGAYRGHDAHDRTTCARYHASPTRARG